MAKQATNIAITVLIDISLIVIGKCELNIKKLLHMYGFSFTKMQRNLSLFELSCIVHYFKTDLYWRFDTHYKKFTK